MSDIVFGKVLTVPMLYGGCGIHGVTCMGNAQMLAFVEEVGGPSGNPSMRASVYPYDGSGYAIGDTGRILSGNQDALYVIDSVAGPVLTLHLTAAGTFYLDQVSVGTAVTSGSGAGLVVSVAASPTSLNYAAGDTGYVVGGGGNALYVVDTVDGIGQVLTMHLTDLGSGYVDGSGVATGTSGAGSGLLLAITTSAGQIVGIVIEGGAITTILPYAGSGYAVGDTGYIPGGTTHATFVVTAVDVFGGVAEIQLSSYGSGYASGSYENIATVTTSGSGSGLALYVDVYAANEYPQRILYSGDNGVTWTERPYFPSEHNLWLWRAYSPGLNIVLVGNEGPDQCDPPSVDDAIARTTDGGFTWGKAVQDDVIVYDCTESYDIFDFVPLNFPEVWAVGAFGNKHHYLRSTNNGQLFPTSTRASVEPVDDGIVYAGAYCGSDIVVLGGHSFGANQNAKIWRTTDRGANWTSIMLPLTQYAGTGAGSQGHPNSVLFLGSGIVLATGFQLAPASVQPPRLWRSTDSGATWAEITDSIPSWTPTGTKAGVKLLNMGNGRVVLGMTGKPSILGNSNWRLSEDSGVTWAVCTVTAYTDPLTTYVTVQDMALADDGSVIVTLIGSENEIWRGVPDFAAIGPCGAAGTSVVTTTILDGGNAAPDGPAPPPPAPPPDAPPPPPVQPEGGGESPNLDLYMSSSYVLGTTTTCSPAPFGGTPAGCTTMEARHVSSPLPVAFFYPAYEGSSIYTDDGGVFLIIYAPSWTTSGGGTPPAEMPVFGAVIVPFTRYKYTPGTWRIV